MPVLFLLNWIFSFFSLVFIIAEIVLVREWYVYKDSVDSYSFANNCLNAAFTVLFFMIFGRYIVRFILGRRSGKSVDEESPKRLRSKEKTTLERSDGSIIYMDFFGPKNGIPLIMIHDWGTSSTEWYYQKMTFSKQFRLILIDLPGMGRSKPSRNNDFSLSKYSLDLKAIINFIGKDVFVWGHGFGGMVLLTYFKNFPKESKRVKGLILQNTTYTNPLKTSIASKFLLSIQKPFIEPLLKLHIYLSPYYKFKYWMSYLNGSLHLSNLIGNYTRRQSRGMLELSARLSVRPSPAVLAKGILGMFKYDVTDALNKIDVATLVLGAERDRLTKCYASEYMHEHIQGSKLEMIGCGGHMSIFENNKEVCSIVEGFLECIKHKADNEQKEEEKEEAISWLGTL